MVLATPALATTALAADTSAQTPICFSGSSFLSRFQDIEQTYPVLHGLLDSGGERARLDRLLIDEGKRRGADFKERVEFETLGRLAPGADANVLALAFDREMVLATRIGDTWKLLVELSFEALVFDFHSNLVRASFPNTIQFIDTFAAAPTAQEEAEAVGKLVLSDARESVCSAFWESWSGLSLPQAGARSIRVADVSLTDTAAAALRTVGAPSDRKVCDQIGFEFSGYLSTNQRLSLQPYGVSDAVNRKMAAQMANGSVYTLTVPPADYEISLRIDGVKKVQTAASAAGSVWVYGAFVTVRVSESLSQRVFFENQVKLGAARTVPASEDPADSDWPAYEEVLRQLFNEFTQPNASADPDWERHHLAYTEYSLKTLQLLLDSCR
jgi:hypothetical protein